MPSLALVLYLLKINYITFTCAAVGNFAKWTRITMKYKRSYPF